MSFSQLVRRASSAIDPLEHHFLHTQEKGSHSLAIIRDRMVVYSPFDFSDSTSQEFICIPSIQVAHKNFFRSLSETVNRS